MSRGRLHNLLMRCLSELYEIIFLSTLGPEVRWVSGERVFIIGMLIGSVQTKQGTRASLARYLHRRFDIGTL